jgi:SAM-dependent methyltransferase/polysaccharide pyruvyl transferase WcaK-like protein
MVFISPRPTLAELDAIYSKGQFSREARGAEAPDEAKVAHSEEDARRRVETVRPLITGESSGPGRSVLDIGCGLGSFLRHFKNQGWEAEGLEPDPTYARIGSDMYGLPIRPMMFEDFDKPERSLDLIATFHVLEHVLDPGAFVRRAASLLKPGGLLFIEVPCIEKPYDGNLDFFFWSVHVNTFSSNTLRAFLETAGLIVESYGYHNYFLWMIARRAEHLVSKPPSYPCDPPRAIYDRTHAAHSAFRRWQSDTLHPASLPRRAVRKLAQSPRGFATAIGRRLKAGGAKAARFALLAATNPAAGAEKLAVKLGVVPPRGVETPSLLTGRPVSGGPVLSHVASYNPNAGDVLLPVALRDLFTHVMGPIRWRGIQAHPVVTDRVVAEMNRTRGVVVGGGGLFLRDTNANANSGWQWNCPIPALRSIKGPLALFAVGYNRFRGQPDFDPIFSEHLTLVAEKAVYIGLRNSGSIRAVRQYLPSELHHKLRYQPCMTTLMTKLYPHLILPERSAPPFVALNCAFDRSALRFGDRKEAILRRIAEAMHRIQATIPIRYYAHMALDDEVLPFLDERGVKYEYVSLQGADPAEIVRAYSRPALTIGMRGHAQMIPFGCGRPVLSLISHDKLRWFLEDIDATEWGLEVDDDDLADRLPAVAIEMVERAGDVEKQFDTARDRLWDISVRNVADLARAFGIAGADLGHAPATPAPAEVSGERPPALTPTHGGS